MNETQRAFIQAILADHQYMTLATVRPDGWPQATTVAFASEGLELYFACDPGGQKVANIGRCDKVSATIDREQADWNRIRGLSLGGTARVLVEPAERAHAQTLLRGKFPQWAETPSPEEPSLIAFVRVTPKVFSLLDYTKGFGHTELVEV
jgi:nitroimidazol reductase NimA-like FMN-containing flavoprotein (pyridoxamine 5'-phosphate oxidase superfamily)